MKYDIFDFTSCKLWQIFYKILMHKWLLNNNYCNKLQFLNTFIKYDKLNMLYTYLVKLIFKYLHTILQTNFQPLFV